MCKKIIVVQRAWCAIGIDERDAKSSSETANRNADEYANKILDFKDEDLLDTKNL